MARVTARQLPKREYPSAPAQALSSSRGRVSGTAASLPLALPGLLEEEHGRCADNPMVARSRAEIRGARFELMWQHGFVHKGWTGRLVRTPAVRQNR